MAKFFDAHVHIWDLKDPDYSIDLRFGPPPDLDASLDQLIRIMDQNGVGRAAVVQPGCYGFNSSLILNIIHSAPERFVGLGMVDPTKPQAADDLSEGLELGLRGLRVLGRWLDAPYMEDIWRRAAQSTASLSFLTGPIDLAPLARFLSRLPETPIILDHLAHRQFDKVQHCSQLLELAKYPHVYVKLSGLYALSRDHHPHPDGSGCSRKFIRHLGPQRLMSASRLPIYYGYLWIYCLS